MITRVTFVFLTIFLFSSVVVAQKQAHLAKIEVIGVKRVTPEQVIKSSELEIGQVINPSIIDAAAQKLMQSGLFKTLGYRVRTQDDQATLIFEVVEAARNMPAVFENFVWFSDDEIMHAIRQDVPFFDGTVPVGGTTGEKITAALQRLLVKKNIPGRVESLPYADESGKQEILFTVKGVKIRVCALHFPGAEAIPETQLIQASQDLLKADYSKKDAGLFALYTLFPLYQRIGHLRATFAEPTAKVDPESCADGVSMTINVEEGVAYAWDKAEWTGNQAVTAEDLSAALGMQPGEVANGFKIDEGLKEVRKAFAHRGYITASARPTIEFDNSKARVTYRFAVNEGPRYFMGKLVVSGLSPPDEEELRSKWTLGTNAVFDAAYVDDFRLNTLLRFIGTQMQRSTAFRFTAEIDVKPDRQKTTVDVIITFKPRPAQ